MVNAVVGVDVGGTFTDVVLIADGELTTTKVPSTADQSDGVVHGIQQACADAGIDPAAISEFSHAMTVSTNALLEGDGARTALVTTDGFRDVLEIGRQTRPKLYDLQAEKPPALVRRRDRLEIDERTTTNGERTVPEPDDVARLVETLRSRDVESVVVSFLHAYVDERNEALVADRLREELDVAVSASHEVLNEFREYERTSTAAVDAYVTPAIDSYVSRLAERATELGLPQPRIMQSNGGIASATEIRSHAVQTVLSGPAAGVVGASRAATADESSFEGFVTFDMGGTSSDVSLIRDGDVERTTENEIGGYPIRVPMVDVTTVGAGGGSIAWVDAGGALRVGPKSAGSDPGPACYGLGGETPTVTDATLVLGYIDRNTELGGELELEYEPAVDALDRLADEAGLDSPTEAARGVFRVANANMTRAIRSVTVERGHDPREFGLVAFGGAGPMHAVALAESLNVGTVVVPRVSGVLSAYGLLDADETYDAVRTHQTPLEATTSDALEDVYRTLLDELPVEDGPAVDVRRSADLRYSGQSFELEVEATAPVDTGALRSAFERKHERVYGYTADEQVEVVNLRAAATIPRSAPATTAESGSLERLGDHTALFDGDEHRTPVYRRPTTPERTVDGPAVLEGDESTTVVPPGWDATVRENGSLVLTEVDR